MSGFSPPTVLSPEYIELAAARAAADCKPHFQPEAFGYDFAGWISPFTKGAHQPGGIALVLQDWASSDGLHGGPDPVIQEFGRQPSLRTNRRLEELLRTVCGKSLSEVYATNIFPFVKGGSMSSALSASDVLNAARQFAVPELVLASPRWVFALGAVAYRTLVRCNVRCIALPHPAARIGGLKIHEQTWRFALRELAL